MNLFDYEKAHLNALKPYLPECIVLLKNDSDFCVDQPGKIALYGNGVRHTRKGGTGSGEVNSRYFITVEEGFQNAGFSITTKEWLDQYEKVLPAARKAFRKQVQAEAREHHKNTIIYGMGMVMPEPEYDIPLTGEGELAVYVLSRICGEGNDRKAIPGDLLLTEAEKRTILELNARFDKFLLVLNVGGPVDLSPVISVKNILVLSQLGVDTGTVLADVVLGKVNPSGKLTTTWSAVNDYCAEGSFGDWSDTYYNEGIYVGYRYFDTVGKKALFPFGFGLSFTRFAIKNPIVAMAGSSVQISVDVKNIGTKNGKEVVQVYATSPEGELNQPYQSLIGFTKTTELIPGETSTVSVDIPIRNLTSYSEDDQAYVLEAGDYVIRVGNSSVDTVVAAVLQFGQKVIIKQVKNVLGDSGFQDMILPRTIGNIPADTPIIPVHTENIVTETVIYESVEELNPIVKELTDEQLIYLSIGHFMEGGGIDSVIGEASSLVCGAAGETASKANENGVPTLVMADGPAGIRIASDFYTDEKGNHALGNQLMDGMTDIMGPFLKAILKLISPKEKKGVEVKHQYCTAIPIGTAIAQSFNTEFANLCGDIVGDEMERFHIDLWLAPALNIHRNILCGRNFEYYSEDPLVSGKMAAAITNGVQKHLGRGTTIKHYAANSQETNRYNSNSHVSERAMREIYLRGFEICVEESQPLTLMTSYNLLNGVHTSENKALVEDILRAEFGFKGFVMTDWVVAMMSGGKKEKYAGPEAYKVAKAGNDVFMPGSKKEFDNLKAALASGKLERAQLEHNVSRVIHIAQIKNGRNRSF